MVFSTAGRAEILRAHQKDELLCEAIRSQLAEVLLRILGSQWFCKYNTCISFGSRHLYYALTTLSDLQTLGEEYTGIVMVDRTQKKLPSQFARIMMIFAQCGGLEILCYLLKKLQKHVLSLPSSSNADQDACHKVSNLILLMEKILPFLGKIHTSLFYLDGASMDFSKRITGIRYVLHHHWVKDQSTDTLFQAVFVTSLMHLLLAAHQAYKKVLDEFSQSDRTQYSGDVKRVKGLHCSLCLEELISPSATTCGHVFCWTCILEWLKSQEQCPICKDIVTPSRVVLLQNYP